MASKVRFKFPANGSRPPVDLVWYDGGMRPPIPAELLNENKMLPEEGMMFVGDNGKILAGFNVQDPHIISGPKKEASKPKAERDDDDDNKMAAALALFAESCKSGKQYPGSFPEADYLAEAINLYAVALRANSMLQYDAANLKITNNADANKYLNRDYRDGWDPEKI
jgi:hypothetical protein